MAPTYRVIRCLLITVIWFVTNATTVEATGYKGWGYPDFYNQRGQINNHYKKLCVIHQIITQ